MPNARHCKSRTTVRKPNRAENKTLQLSNRAKQHKDRPWVRLVLFRFALRLTKTLLSRVLQRLQNMLRQYSG